MRIFSADISYYTGWVCVDYNTQTKKIEIIDYGIVNVKNKKSHKNYYLKAAMENLIKEYKPNLVLYESQFKNLMYMISGAFEAAIPPEIKIEKIFSKRARKLAFDDGALSKEDAAEQIIKIFPSLKGKEADVLDAMVLVLAWIQAHEKREPLKLPKKPKTKRKPKN